MVYTCTVDWEIFSSRNFRVLHFHAFYFRRLAKWRKFFTVYNYNLGREVSRQVQRTASFTLSFT